MNVLGPMIRRIRRAVKGVVHPAIAPLAVRAFRARAARAEGIEEALDLVYSFDFGAIRTAPVQIRSEITTFLRTLSDLAPRVILEVGTANGGSLFLFSRVAAPDALLISIDLPGGKFGGGYPPWCAPLFRSFAHRSQRMELVRADSHDPGTVTRVKALLSGRQVDFLFIDGDHSYQGVSSDYELYAPLVRPGGIIGFHDIVAGPASEVGGVPAFWEELKRGSRVTEIVADWTQGGYGIGWIETGADSAPVSST